MGYQLKTTPLIFVSLTGFAMLSGCATPFTDYNGTAKRVAIANLCEREKFISTSEFNSYAAFQFGEYAHQNMQIVDMPKLQSMYLNELEQGTKLMANASQRDREQLRLNCAQIATVAQKVAPGRNSPAPQLVPTAPTTTNCMTTQGWTRCTSN